MMYNIKKSIIHDFEPSKDQAVKLKDTASDEGSGVNEK